MKQITLLERVNEIVNAFINEHYPSYLQDGDKWMLKGKGNVDKRVAIGEINDQYPINLYRLDAAYKVYNGPGFNAYRKYISKELLAVVDIVIEQGFEYYTPEVADLLRMNLSNGQSKEVA